MAGEKPTFDNSDAKTVERIISLLVGLLLLGAVATALLAYIERLGLGLQGEFWTRIIDYFLQHIWPIWKVVAVIVSALALAGIIYNFKKLKAINIVEQKIFDPTPADVLVNDETVAVIKNEQWEKVLKYLNSDNASDWRLAIIEADVMLGDLLGTLGYVGESIGERLKSVEEGEFLTIQDAWEAHKVRNAIAHSDAGFQLNGREIRRVIGLYENVFREFRII